MKKPKREESEWLSASEQFEHQRRLGPFWRSAEKVALDNLEPAPEEPQPEMFGLTKTEAKKLLMHKSSAPSDRANIFWVLGFLPFVCIVVWLSTDIAEYLFKLWNPSENNRAGLKLVSLIFSALGSMRLYSEIQPLCKKYANWVEEAWHDKHHPRWRQYFHEWRSFEEKISAYNKSKYELTKFNAERQCAYAFRKEEVWRRLSGIDFERELARLYTRMGYHVEQTPYTSDGGVDLLMRKDGRLTIVQCKAHKTRVSINTARELYAAMMDFKADEAIIACFEGVTKPVEEYSRSRAISILTLKEILPLYTKYCEL